MPAQEPGKIRNVAVVGHQGRGRPLSRGGHALPVRQCQPARYGRGGDHRLQTAGRLSSAGRCRVSASLLNVEWQGRKINRSAPGRCGLPGRHDRRADGRRGRARRRQRQRWASRSGLGRTWHRGESSHVARVVVVSMLDRERADSLPRARGAPLRPRRARLRASTSPLASTSYMCAYTSPEGQARAWRSPRAGRPGRRATGERSDAVVETG